MEYVVKMERKKKYGADQVPVELIKLTEHEWIEIVVNLYNTVYAMGTIPEEGNLHSPAKNQ